jgi:hypothetical protein
MRLLHTRELRLKHLTLFVVAAALAGSAQADALGDFNPIFANCQATYKAIKAGGVVADTPPNWVRKITTTHMLKYDITQKFYSSPFVAVMTIELTESFGSADSQVAAQQLVVADSNRLKRDVTRISYIYQNGRWAATEAEQSTEIKRTRVEPWGPAAVTRVSGDALRSSAEPWAACVK